MERIHDKEFRSWPVHREIDKMVDDGYLEDTSWHNDAMPSFGMRLADGKLLRLWVGHPNKSKREFYPEKYVVEIQPDFGEASEETVIATNDIEEALFHVMNVVEKRGQKKPRFRLLGWGRRA